MGHSTLSTASILHVSGQEKQHQLSRVDVKIEKENVQGFCCNFFSSVSLWLTASSSIDLFRKDAMLKMLHRLSMLLNYLLFAANVQHSV